MTFCPRITNIRDSISSTDAINFLSAKAVHGDVTALLNAGLLSKTDDGMIVFPFDAIHVDFMLKAA